MLELLSAAPQATLYASFSFLLGYSQILGNVFFWFLSSPGQSDHLSSADKKAFLMDHVNYASYRIQIKKINVSVILNVVYFNLMISYYVIY